MFGDICTTDSWKDRRYRDSFAVFLQRVFFLLSIQFLYVFVVSETNNVFPPIRE